MSHHFTYLCTGFQWWPSSGSKLQHSPTEWATQQHFTWTLSSRWTILLVYYSLPTNSIWWSWHYTAKYLKQSSVVPWCWNELPTNEVCRLSSLAPNTRNCWRWTLDLSHSFLWTFLASLSHKTKTFFSCGTLLSMFSHWLSVLPTSLVCHSG